VQNKIFLFTPLIMICITQIEETVFRKEDLRICMIGRPALPVEGCKYLPPAIKCAICLEKKDRTIGTGWLFHMQNIEGAGKPAITSAAIFVFSSLSSQLPIQTEALAEMLALLIHFLPRFPASFGLSGWLLTSGREDLKLR